MPLISLFLEYADNPIPTENFLLIILLLYENNVLPMKGIFTVNEFGESIQGISFHTLILSILSTYTSCAKPPFFM